jgi:hypothetical protein
MTAYFIEPDWLAVASGGVFYYPAAGADLEEPIHVFSSHVNTFHFCDISYESLDLLPHALGSSPSHIRYVGPLRATMDRIGGIRHIDPGKRIETHERRGAEPLVIVRRRGFGQMGLAEFSPRSISVFMHRGDSMGEGGSNAWFLSDRPSRHPPLGRLYTALQTRLRGRALIVTDGSNTYKDFLLRHKSWPPVSGAQAYAEERGRTYCFGGLRWTCVGWLSERYGPTLIWGVTNPGNGISHEARFGTDDR